MFTFAGSAKLDISHSVGGETVKLKVVLLLAALPSKALTVIV